MHVFVYVRIQIYFICINLISGGLKGLSNCILGGHGRNSCAVVCKAKGK